ncbi:hypothetical protein [Nocardia pseudobrasiliensis]|uniref:Uncharacterized protein n=1 Tax=Nocardia pseudobrasiliensis TaxID=45979 RepID=A0A370I4R7_9NOCA|nr:hypothetical protein [Nocardia pseudobrasiliensis]RDI65699.1 hypothetical protein DFR76_10514 [Nocardia pseudobrasiliensis]
MSDGDPATDPLSETTLVTQCGHEVHLEAYQVEGTGYVVITHADGTTDEITAAQATDVIAALGVQAHRMAAEYRSATGEPEAVTPFHSPRSVLGKFKGWRNSAPGHSKAVAGMTAGLGVALVADWVRFALEAAA